MQFTLLWPDEKYVQLLRGSFVKKYATSYKIHCTLIHMGLFGVLKSRYILCDFVNLPSVYFLSLTQNSKSKSSELVSFIEELDLSFVCWRIETGTSSFQGSFEWKYCANQQGPAKFLCHCWFWRIFRRYCQHLWKGIELMFFQLYFYFLNYRQGC